MFDILERFRKRGELFGKPAYRVFQLYDKNPLAGTTKIRTISAPNEAMAVICQMLYGGIRLRLRKMEIEFPFSTAVMPGNSPLKNVLRHKGSRYFYLLDIKDFYLGIKGEQIVACLLELMPGFFSRDKLEKFLDEYCLSEEKVLRMGGPASPDLANIVAARFLDKPLAPLCFKYGITYSRYLDDMTFSSKDPIGERKRRAIRDIISATGFAISSKKSVYADITKKPITITGIGIHSGGRIFVKRSFLKKIAGLVNLVEKNKAEPRTNPKTGREMNPANIVVGLMSAFWSTIPEDGRELNKLERELIWKYLAFREKDRENREKPQKLSRLEKKMRKMLE